MVLHTLAVDPAANGRGYARAFVRFYEEYAAARGCREISVSVKETDDRRSLKAELAVDLACSPPDAQAIEALFGGVFGLKCKNFHAEYIGSTLVFSLCPAVFDPDAEGLMQGGGILRAERRKNEASRRI